MRFLRTKKLLLLIIFILSNFVVFTVTSSPSGDNIIITEILYDAPNSDDDEEWFELFNPTDSSVDLSGWTIEDNYDSFNLSGTIPAKGYFVIARQSAAFNLLYGFDPDLDVSPLALSNSGDKLTLYNNMSTVVDFVAWENYVSGWSVSAIDTTIRRTNVVDTDTGVDWENSGFLGNPGDGPYDEILSDVTPPLVNIMSPVSGANLTGSVEISVNATDENGIVRYEIYIDGVLRATQNPFLWNTRTVSNGSHTILAKCKDPANNVGEHNITVTVENNGTISSSDLIKIMSYNIEYGIDPDWKDVVKEENPDIVIFIETGNWDDNSDELLNQYIAEFNAYFVDEEPYTGYTAQGIVYSTDGEAIMSRYPILETVQIPLVTLDDDSMFDVSHDFMYWKVDVAGTELYLIGAHLKAMSGADNEYRREREQEGIINYMDSLGEVPILYLGDLNSFSPYDTGALAPEGDLGYGPLTMMLKPGDSTYGQYASQTHIFTDVFRTLNPSDLGYTYGHQNPTFDSRIDFIIANDYLSNYLVNSTVGDTSTADTGSDHYCVDFFLDVYALQSKTDFTAPAKVIGVSGEGISSSRINLAWNPSSEDDFDHYNIYRDGTYITQTINSSYSDSELNGDTLYTYEISAVDTSGNEGIKSDGVIVRTQDKTIFLEILLSIGGLIICLAGLTLIMFKHNKKKKGA